MNPGATHEFGGTVGAVVVVVVDVVVVVAVQEYFSTVVHC
jgi:hypothetical protein